jgi:hypothetical protein
MDACVDIAVDCEPDEIISRFVEPLAARLQERAAGSVVRHSSDELWVHVDLALPDFASMDHVLEFLAEADAPVGSMIYRVDDRGNKQYIFVLAPPTAEYLATQRHSVTPLCEPKLERWNGS